MEMATCSLNNTKKTQCKWHTKVNFYKSLISAKEFQRGEEIILYRYFRLLAYQREIKHEI